ncbi:MAG: DUF3824 domain-containing protein [Planctomycetota bacterium]
MSPSIRSPLVLSALAGALLVSPVLSQGCPPTVGIPGGCPGSFGTKPTQAMNAFLPGGPVLEFTVTHTAALGPVAVAFGSPIPPIPYLGCTFNVSFDIVTGLMGPDANGQTVIPIPLSTALNGISIAAQSVEFDAAAPAGIAVSDGIAIASPPSCFTDSELVTAVLGYGELDARAAYEALFYRGPATIPAILGGLIPLAAGQPAVCGAVPHHESSSIYAYCVDPRLVLCYLLESYYRNNITPWGAPEVNSTSALVKVDDDVVTQEYINWALALPAFTQAAVSASPDPLQNTVFVWTGAQYPPPPPNSGDASIDGPPWNEVGPTTPYAPGPWPPFTTGMPPMQPPGAWDPPTPPGMVPPRQPYNCYAWAQGCHMDRWVQPTPPPGAPPGAPKTSLDDIFPGTKQVSEPKAGQDCVKIVHFLWQPKDFVGPPYINECTAAHAMKTDDGGTNWSSKNGSAKRYDMITDCEEFLDTFYPKADFCVMRGGQLYQQLRIIEYRCDC